LRESKTLEKTEEKSRMDNPEKLEAYGTQNTDEDKQSKNQNQANIDNA